MIGQTISHYKILAQIGRGGMGIVYKAEDTRLKRQVALKFLPDHLTDDKRAMERFYREAQTASSLNHPHICTIYDIGEHEGRPFIAMELLEGETLRDTIQGGQLDVSEILDFGIQIADGLDAAHSHGVIHRDIKPANIFITKQRVAKILDFGLAKAPAGYDQTDGDLADAPTMTVNELTTSGVSLGTVSFMSPEQARGETLDARTDLFSLGQVLYQMATGKMAFEGKTAAVVFHAILETPPKPPSRLNPDLPPELDRIIIGALEKDRAVRLQSASQLRAELKRLQREVLDLRSGGTASVEIAAPDSRLVPWAVLTIAGLVAVSVVLYLVLVMAPSTAMFPTDVSITQLTSRPGEELFPNLSPNGDSIIYTSYATGMGDVYLQRVDGVNATNLTADSDVYDGQASFSPDGNLIAFRSDRQGGGIFLMGATGESARRLVDFGNNPAWSPNQSQIVFATERISTTPERRFGISALWTVTVATEEPTKIYDGDAVQPSWSPDGSRIVFWANQGGQRDIWTVSASGQDPVRVTNDPALDWSPVWSGDGYIYFSSDRGGSMNLWRLPVDGDGKPRGAPQAVTTEVVGNSQHPNVSADGNRVAYSVRVDSRNIRSIAFDPALKQPSGLPGPVTEGSIASEWNDPTPDGSMVAFTQQNDIFVSGADGVLTRLTDDDFNNRRPR